MSYLRYLCLFAHSGVQHISCCVFVLFFLVLCTPCRHFLWIIHFWLPLRFSILLVLLYTTAWIWDANKAGLTAEKYGHYELQPKSRERPPVLSWLTSSILVVSICSDNWYSEIVIIFDLVTPTCDSQCRNISIVIKGVIINSFFDSIFHVQTG